MSTDSTTEEQRNSDVNHLMNTDVESDEGGSSHVPMCRFQDASTKTIRQIMRWSIMECTDPDVTDEIQRLGTRLMLLISRNHTDA